MRNADAPRSATSEGYAKARSEPGIAAMTATISPHAIAPMRAPRATYARTCASSPEACARATSGKRICVTLKRSWYGRNAKSWQAR